MMETSTVSVSNEVWGAIGAACINGRTSVETAWSKGGGVLHRGSAIAGGEEVQGAVWI
jgi:hypothetical protein